MAVRLEKIDEWGKRDSAYPIQYLNDGYYVLMTFEAEPTLPVELERNYKISDDVIRYIGNQFRRKIKGCSAPGAG